jgi:hypothetical protein
MGDALTLEGLRRFRGSEHWHRHPRHRDALYTDGVRHVATLGRAYWLIDDIMLAQRLIPKAAAKAFQIWRLTLRPDCSAVLSCQGGGGNMVLEREIEWTDFPLDTITLYYTNRTLLLASEH